MIYISQPDISTAISRSEAIAQRLGSAATGSITKRWYPVISRSETTDPKYPNPMPDGVNVGLLIYQDSALDLLIREDELTAEEISDLVDLYAGWQDDTVYATGDIRKDGGDLWECVQGHASQMGWEPNNVPALWVRKTPANVIPIWIQPTGGHDAYALGAQVTHNGQVWQSDYAANVWEPGVFGWTQV